MRSPVTKSALLLVALVGCTEILGVSERTLVDDGGATGGGGNTTSGGGDVCPLLTCGDECVNPFTDDRHCGYCDVECSGGQTCSNGQCDQRLRTSTAGEQCARVEDELVCWGATFNGESGTGVASVSERFPALAVTVLDGLPPPRFMTRSGHSACALLDDGSIRCFGDNSKRALGNGSTGGPEDAGAGDGCCHITAAVAPALPEGAVFVDIAGGGAAAEDDFYLALSAAGDVYCWGRRTSSPVVMVAGAVQIVAGKHFGCALLETGRVECFGTPWGAGINRSVCDQTVTTMDLPPARLLGAGQIAAFAVASDGAIYAWGQNVYDVLGPGFATSYSYYPPRLMDPVFESPVVQIAGAHSATCVRLLNGDVHCWGENGFQGDGTPAKPGSDPTPRRALEGAAELGAGKDDMSAIDVHGDVVTWSRFYAAKPQKLATPR